MSILRELGSRLSKSVEIYADELDKAGCDPDGGEPNLLSSEGLAARDEIIAMAEKLLRQARGPVPAVLNMLESVISLPYNFWGAGLCLTNFIGSRRRHYSDPDPT